MKEDTPDYLREQTIPYVDLFIAYFAEPPPPCEGDDKHKKCISLEDCKLNEKSCMDFNYYVRHGKYRLKDRIATHKIFLLHHER